MLTITADLSGIGCFGQRPEPCLPAFVRPPIFAVLLVPLPANKLYPVSVHRASPGQKVSLNV